jgi:opacity protein-like surface antigen
MRNRNFVITAALALLATAAAFAADVTGTWTASFETQVGTQNYTYTFKVEGGKLTGTTKSNLSETASAITNGIVNGDDISFTENLNYQGMQFQIPYKGKISGDEIKFTRTVVEGTPEDLVAKRAK